MTPRFSLYLDLLRFGAALVVVLSHFGYARFSGGGWEWVRVLNLGSDAVVVFFILSGFVIAFSAAQKDADLRTFAFNRLTRLWSVAVPALVLGFVLDRVGAALNPAAYGNWWYAPLPLGETLLRGLTFSNEWGGLAQRLGSNGPFWSLSYEAAYYALFAVAFYLTGMRRVVLLAVLVVLVGGNVLLLLPCWLLGVAIYRWTLRGHDLTRTVSLGLSVLPLLVYAVCQGADVMGQLRGVTQAVLAAPDLQALRFSDEFLWNWVLALLVGCHVLGMANLLRGGVGQTGDAGQTGVAGQTGRVVRWLAGASFSIYVVHYPCLMFLDAVLPEALPLALRNAALLAGTLAACLIFAEAFERPLRFWRGLARLAICRILGRAPDHLPA